ncbi:YonK family protein [Priestia megaterium]|uniref:YonK family protein n=1 Tax=Priestia aryabhattai TaxID=412384 RepID=UPI00353252EA
MAKLNHTLTFKNATISLEDNEIVEYMKEDIQTHTLSDIIKRFEGKNLDITFKEVSDLEPAEVDGE